MVHNNKFNHDSIVILICCSIILIGFVDSSSSTSSFKSNSRRNNKLEQLQHQISSAINNYDLIELNTVLNSIKKTNKRQLTKVLSNSNINGKSSIHLAAEIGFYSACKLLINDYKNNIIYAYILYAGLIAK